MRRVWLGAFALGAWAAAAAGLTGCFHPDKPACAFSCAEPPHTCPTDFVCGADNLCHDPTSTGSCRIILGDAATDAGDDPATADAGAATDSGTGG
jgi:hypothetical protein